MDVASLSLARSVPCEWHSRRSNNIKVVAISVFDDYDNISPTQNLLQIGFLCFISSSYLAFWLFFFYSNYLAIR